MVLVRNNNRRIKVRIGIIGRGFVGGSMEKYLLEHSHHDVQAFDAKDGDVTEGYNRIVGHSEMIYVAVPTPMDKNGKCHTAILEESLALINYLSMQRRDSPVVLIKSTMSPGTSERLKKEFTNIIIVTNPEFLTERNAYEDLCNAKQHVLGLPEGELDGLRAKLEAYHKQLWQGCKCIFVSNTEAELIKYLTNTYFSVKVSFANHMYHISQALGINYDRFINAAIQADPRIEPTHWQVPGPDGQLGFGGKCFPKDLNGMITLFAENGVECPLLETAWQYNLDIREDKDWKRIYGAQVDSTD